MFNEADKRIRRSRDARCRKLFLVEIPRMLENVEKRATVIVLRSCVCGRCVITRLYVADSNANR